MNETVETPAAEPVTAPATPASFTEADFNKYLSEKGLVAKPAADIQTEINQAVRKTHETWENKVGEVIGAEKPNGVAGLDWIKEAITSKPAAPTQTPAVEPATHKVTDDVNAAALKLVQKELSDLRADQAKKEETIRTKKISLDLRAGSHGSLDAKDKDFERKSALILNSLSKDYRWDLDADDNAVPYDASGEVLINAVTQKPYTPAELVKRDYAFMMPKERPAVDGTTRAVEEKPSVTSDGKPFIVATKFEQITEKAQALGLERGSKAYIDFMNESAKASNLKIT